jgi:Protein of unknown function (DUF3060)
MKSSRFAASAVKGLALLASTLVAATASADVTVIENGKTLTVDCAKDKNVTLVGNGFNVTLVGACAAVVVNGNDGEVRGSAARIYVSGNKNKVSADGADQIYVAGNGNYVSWRRGLTRQAPAVSNPGTNNVVAPAK